MLCGWTSKNKTQIALETTEILIYLYKAVMCAVMSVGLSRSRGSRDRDFKSFSEQYHAVENDENPII